MAYTLEQQLAILNGQRATAGTAPAVPAPSVQAAAPSSGYSTGQQLAILGGQKIDAQQTSIPQQQVPAPAVQASASAQQSLSLGEQIKQAIGGTPAADQYSALMSNPDFAQYAAQGAGMAGENPKAGYFGENINLFGWKPFEQEVQNKVLYAKQKYAEANNEQNKILQMGNASAVQPLSEEQLAYVQMSDDETAIYNYLLAKNGTAEADKYLEKIREELNARAATQTVDSATALNSKLPIVGEAATNLGFMAGEGLKGFVRGFTNLAANEAPAVSQSEYAASLARDNLADTLGKLPQAIGDISGGQFAGDILQTVGNMTIPIVTSYVLQGLGVPAPIAEGIASAGMGVSSGSNARVEALRQGYTNDQASLYGTLVGASEAGFQYLFTGIGALGGKLTGITAGAATKNVSSALLKTATTLGVKMAGEGFEEYLQEVLEPVYRNLAFGENNEVVLNSPNSLYSLFVGVVTAGLLEGPSVISNNVTASRAGNAIVQSGHYDTLIDNALQLNPKTDAHKKAKALSSSAKQNSLAAGELLIAYQKDGGDLSFMREPATPAEQFQSVVEGATPEAQAAVDEANALINSGDREAGVAAIKEAARINAQAEVAESRGEVVQPIQEPTPVQPVMQPAPVLPTQNSAQAVVQRTTPTVQPPRSVLPFATTVSQLSKEQSEQLSALREKADADIKSTRTMVKDGQDLARREKAIGMQYSAERRAIIQGDALGLVDGGLTEKELTAKIKRLNSNYVGKPVIVDGVNATVVRTQYGRVVVKFEDGTTKTVNADQIQSRLETPSPVSPIRNGTIKNKTSAPPITVYRGDTFGTDESKRSLSKRQSIMDVLGKPETEVDLLPFKYYSESKDAADLYANRDASIVDAIMKQTYKTKDQAIETFKTLFGKEPVMTGGSTKELTINPKNVLDLTDLGESTTVKDAIKKLLIAQGSDVPVYTRGENVNSPKLEDYNKIERDIMINMPGEVSEDTFPIYYLMKSKDKNDKTGRNFVNWLKENGYDAVRYSEDGTSHYAVLDETQPEMNAQPSPVLPTQTPVQAPASPVGGVSSNSGNTPVDTNAAVANAGELVQGVIGKSGTALTNDNKQINFNYAVVPADSLITSNDISGNVNPNYPQELQPRDRTRVSSIVDISKIANDLQPARLGADATVQNGAPIVGADGIVESGNARTIAINLAYRTGKADAYKQFILDNAAQFGIDSSNIPENPVLVRVRTSEVNRADFTRNANESTVAAYSDYEVAQQDAKKLTPDMLSLFVPNDNGNINSLDNRNFIRRFISEVVPSTERGNVVTETGDLSQSGLQRIRNAIFQRAYNNAELGKRLTELIDDDAKTLMRALINSAPNAVSLVSGIESGYYYPMNVTNDIASAAEKYVQLREQNKSVYDYLVQASFVSDISPEANFLLSVIEANAKKRRHVVLTTFMNAVYDRVVSMGDPNQVSLFNDVAYATKGEILNAAKAKYERDNGKILEGHESEYGQGTLFSELAFQNAQQTENEREVAASASVQKVTEPASEQPRVQNNSSALPSVLPNNDGLGAKTSEFVPERKTSKVYENTYMNTDVFAEADKAMMDEADYEYDVVSERKSMTAAAQRLYSDFDGEISDLLQRDARLWSGEDVDTAMGALSKLMKDNDPRATALSKKLQQAGTEAGRAAQAFAKYTRTKEGALPNALRQIAKHKAETLAAKGKKWMDKHASLFELTAEEQYDIVHNAEIAETLPEGRDRDILFAKNQAIVDSFQHASKGRMIMAFMRIQMLLNFKTQMRNIAGNGTIVPINTVVDFIRAPFDKLLSKRSGVRTTGLPQVKTIAKGAVQGLSEQVQDYRMGIDTSPSNINRWDVTQKGNASPFNPRLATNKFSKATLRALNGVDRFLSFVMAAGDRPFYQAAYNNSLLNQMRLNGASTPTADMIDIARTEAAQRTWNDTNEFTKFVIQLRDGLNNIGNKTGKKREFGFGSILVPFAKTPANLVKALLDYSPVGLVSNVLLQDVSTYNRALRGDGNISVAKAQFELVNDFGKAIAGSLVMTLGYFLAAAGQIRGGNDDDKDKSYFERYVLGLQPYSFKIGDKTYTYDWMQPVGTSFAIMADFQRLMETGNISGFGLDALGTAGNAILTALSTGGNVLFEQSFLQGIQNMFEADGIVQGAIEVVANLPTMFMSSLLRAVGQLADDTARTSFAYGNLPETTKRKIMGSLPWAVGSLEPMLDTRGKDVKRSGGENNWWNVFFNPSNVSKNISDKTAKALYALYEITGDKTIFPRVAPYYLEDKNGNKKVLTPEQRTKYQKAIGDQTWKAFTDALNSSEYAKLSNKQKAKVFSDIVSHVNTMVKKDFLKEGYTPELQKIADAIKSGHPMAEYVTAKMLINGATAPAGSPNGTSAAQKSKVINEYAGLSESSKYYYMKMENQSAAKAEEKGVSFDVYAGYMQAYTGFTGEDKNSDGRADTNSRKKQAIAWMKAQGYDAATINALLYVGDWKPDYKG